MATPIKNYNSNFVYCRVKRSPIPLETSKQVHTIYNNILSFARLFPLIKIRFAENMKYHFFFFQFNMDFI